LIEGGNRAVEGAAGKFDHKRNRAQRIADKLFVEERLLKGRTHTEIANALALERPYTLSRQMIAKIAKELQDDWKLRAAALVDQVKARILASMDQQERELWDMWERSKQDAVGTVTEAITLKAGEARVPAERVTTSRDGQCGNPALMRLILDIHDRRSKFLGLDAPTKTEAKVTATVEQTGIDYSKLTLEELRTLEQIALKSRPDGDPSSNGGIKPA
jgi:hypothetical protein